MRKNKIFVYGILLNQFENKPAILKGYKRITRGFPSIRKNKDAQVKGQLIQVDKKTFDYLDKVESKGHYYDRHRVDVIVDNEIVKNVWVYQQIEDIKDDKKM